MSCWVVPAIAADYWGVPVEDVLSAIAGGRVPFKNDAGWIFVDIAPDGPRVEAAGAKPESRQTWVPVIHEPTPAVPAAP